MPRYRADIDDMDETLFDQDEAKERRRARAEMIERAEQRKAQDDEAERIRSDLARATAKARSEHEIASGYAARRVTPPCVHPQTGLPTCSIDMLFKIGWTIVDLPFGERAMVPPAHLQGEKSK